MKAKTIKKQYISFGTYFGSGYYESEEDIINYMYAINYTMSSKNDDGDIIVIPKEGEFELIKPTAEKETCDPNNSPNNSSFISVSFFSK